MPAGSLSARFLTNARVVAGADVAIENVSDNSSILCGGELRADQGTLLSGHAIAGVAITSLRGPLTITLASQGGRQVVVCTDDYRGTKTCLSTVDQSAPVPNA